MFLLLSLALAAPRDDLVTPDVLPAWAGRSGDAQVDGPWWTTFGDPGLTRLLEAALVANRDMRAAWARAEQSRISSRTAVAPLLPQASFEASANLAPTASRGFQFGGLGGLPGAEEPPKTYWTGQAAFQASWELDVFMKNTQGMRASRFDAMAAEGDRDAAVQAFATRLAEGYFDLVTAHQRAAIVQRQIETTSALLEIVELRYANGDASAVDVLQQRQQAASVRAQLPIALAAVTQLQQQLAVALALPPATVVDGVAPALPAVPPLPDAGVPGDLILARPDLRAAESRIDATHARHANAVRQLLPTVRVTGQAGWQFFDETELKSQTFWGAGASLSVPLFAGGRTHAGIGAARAGEFAAVHSYTQLAANAVLEVESALVLDQRRSEQVAATVDQEEAARLAWEEARAQYVAGIGNYLALLTAQTTHMQAELALLDARRQHLSARVQLHDALGGQWTDAVADAFDRGDRAPVRTP